MKTEEFRAWFEGFAEGIDGAPSSDQWERIKQRVSEIDGTQISPVWVERHYREYRPYYQPCNHPWVTISGSAVQSYNAGAHTSSIGVLADAGRAEAASLVN